MKVRMVVSCEVDWILNSLRLRLSLN